MLEKLSDLPPGIEGARAKGTVTKEDYEQVLEPMLEDARREGRRIRFLYEFGSDFEGFAPGAAWEDVATGIRHLRLFEACALVSDVEWLRQSAKMAGFLMPCPVRVFENEDREDAMEWLRSLPQGAGTSHRLLAESG